MSDDLQHISDWMLANYLTLNKEKTYYMIFSTRNVPDIRVTIGNDLIVKKDSGKFLGVILDEKLNFKQHIKEISNKTSKIVGLLSRLKTFFNRDIIINQYYTLFYPHLLYCILAWGGARSNALNSLVLIQKRVIRILSGSSYYAHTTPLFKQMKILKLADLHIFNYQIFMFKTLKLNSFPDIKRKIIAIQSNHRYTTRNENLKLPYIRCELCKNSMIYQGITFWNLLPNEIRNVSTLVLYRRKCKNYLLNRLN